LSAPCPNPFEAAGKFAPCPYSYISFCGLRALGNDEGVVKDLGKWIRVRRWAGGFYFACILLNLLILVYCTRIWYGYGKGVFYGIQLGYYFRLVLADISCSKANATHATWIPYPDDKRWMRRREGLTLM